MSRCYVNLEDVKKIDSNFSMVLRGLEEHLTSDEPDKDYIIDALLVVSESLRNVINAAEQGA